MTVIELTCAVVIDGIAATDADADGDSDLFVAGEQFDPNDASVFVMQNAGDGVSLTSTQCLLPQMSRDQHGM